MNVYIHSLFPVGEFGVSGRLRSNKVGVADLSFDLFLPSLSVGEVDLRVDCSNSPSKPNDSIRSSAAVVPPSGSSNFVCVCACVCVWGGGGIVV